MKVVVKEKRALYDGFFKLEKSVIQYERYDGTMSKEVVRENFHRGDSVAVLIYDPKHRKVLLVKQFRYAVYTNEPSSAWIIELVAGSINKNDDPTGTIVREIFEETHLTIKSENIQLLNTFYLSPGGTSERITLYTVPIDLSGEIAEYGGKEDEQENIKIEIFSFDNVFQLLQSGQIKDAKTIIAIQWLKMNDK